jgi:hypothetical protein
MLDAWYLKKLRIDKCEIICHKVGKCEQSTHVVFWLPYNILIHYKLFLLPKRKQMKDGSDYWQWITFWIL